MSLRLVVNSRYNDLALPTSELRFGHIVDMSDTTPVPGASSPDPSKSGQILLPLDVPEEFTLHLRRRSQEAIKPEGGGEAIAISSPGDLHRYYHMRMSYVAKDGQQKIANDDMLTKVKGI